MTSNKFVIAPICVSEIDIGDILLSDHYPLGHRMIGLAIQTINQKIFVS